MKKISRNETFNIALISLILVLKSFFIYATDNDTTSTNETKVEAQKIKPITPKVENPFAKLILHPQRIDVHRLLIDSLRNCRANNDYVGAAKINAYFAGEAFARAKRVLDYWFWQRDPETSLLPENVQGEARRWITKNSAADCFPFLVIAAYFLDYPRFTALAHTLNQERTLSEKWRSVLDPLLGEQHPARGILPLSFDLLTDKPINQNINEIIFGAAEYCKDGLLAILERLGKQDACEPYFKRMKEITEAIFAAAPVDSDYGKLPSTLAEVNGDMLQVLSRLYWATRDEKYLVWAERIGDAYLLEAIPRNFSLPPFSWDFTQHKAISSICKLRDHGNEIIPGLTELYLIEFFEQRERETRYYQPLKRMLDKILEIGRNPDGIWYNQLVAETGEGPNSGLCDNWGYLYNAYYTFYVVCKLGNKCPVAEQQRYLDAIESTLHNLKKYKSFQWEWNDQDGYADTIESALYLLNRFPGVWSGFDWVDDEIQILFAKQAPQGFIDAMYLDGNFIRTTLLFAFYKTQGTYVTPWRKDVLLGAFRVKNHEPLQRGESIRQEKIQEDTTTDTLFIYIEVNEPWSGKLMFDYPRHIVHLGLPINYPRLNEWPEWFVVDEAREYRVIDLQSNEKKKVSGKTLRQGLKLELTQFQRVMLKIEALHKSEQN